MEAGWAPRLSSLTSIPVVVSNIRISVPFSEAVARRVPWAFRARQDRAAWWASISTGAFSVRARSMSWTCPDFRPIDGNGVN